MNSNKRKRMLLASSLSSSVSSGEEHNGNYHYNSDRSYNNPNPNPNSNSNSNSNSNGDQSPNEENNTSKSFFSGFWSDAELEDEETIKNKNKNKNKNGNSNSNKGSIDYEGFYLTIGDVVYEIGLGDVVAMRNYEEEVYSNNNNNNNNNNRLEQDSENDEAQALEPLEPSSSEYTADALSEKATDYYKAVAPEAAEPKGTKTDSSSNDTDSHKASADADTDVAMIDATAKDAAVTATAAIPVPPQTLPSSSLVAQQQALSAAAAAVAAFPQPSPKEVKVGDGLMLARIERIWQETGGRNRGNSNNSSINNGKNGNEGNEGKVLFKARWFLKKEDVNSLPLGELTGPVSLEKFVGSITEHDLVLSNQSDDNHVTTICDLIQVLYRNPDLDAEIPSHVLPATYLCRYSLRIDDASRVVVLPYTGDNDDWKEMTVSALNSKKRSDGDSSGNSNINSNIGEQQRLGGETSGGQFLHNLMSPTSQDNQKRRRVGDFADTEGIDEGTTEQRDIQIGSDHQVCVPPFVSNQNNNTAIVSRNPVRMWTPDKISQEGTDDYIEKAAMILTPYLRKHRLTQEEPYAPFPTKRMEELSKLLSRKRLPTLSSVSSVSSLTTHKVDALREFNVDALLRNLHVSNYNINAAIAAIEASPKDYLVAWSQHEKARFNTGFRRYSGSLRAIYKGMDDNKALPEVIDYHYRFKIPDQFRRVQERKREQAIRMLECIETKRNLNAPIVVSSEATNSGTPSGGSDENNKEKLDWTKTGSSSLAVSLEMRRIKAKELLLDVEARLGRSKMMKVFEVFKNTDETALLECKNKLLEICRGHQDFQSRFLEFLPQQLRL